MSDYAEFTKLAPFKLTYPVINVRTHEVGRAEIYCKEIAKRVNKAFTKMPFKAVASTNTLEELAKTALADEGRSRHKEYDGVIIFDPHFHERQLTQPHNLSTLRDSTFYMENKGINYVIAGREALKHEFVYHLELPSMPVGEVVELVKESEQVIDDRNAIFSEQERNTIAHRALGLSRNQMKNLFVGSAYLKKNGMDYLEDIDRMKAHILSDSGLEIMQPCPLEAIGGLHLLKDFLVQRQAGVELDIPMKGILLAGAPGCGKTLSAKAAASIFGVGLINLDMARFYSKHLGETEQRFYQALKVIEQVSPCVVLIDEVEKYFGQTQGEHETTRRLLAMFLHWLQERKSRTYIVATCNRVSALPPELMRSGRWDRSFFVDLPTSEEREKIFQIHLEKHQIDYDGFNMSRLIRASDEYSGADIEQAVVDARFLAHAQQKDVDEETVLQALKDITPVSETRREDIEAIRALRNQGFYCANENGSSYALHSRRKVSGE
ncbi:MAG: ATPase [Oleiphilus sp.]|nr:MAG: ATPase [Oleiphilus sp.]